MDWVTEREIAIAKQLIEPDTKKFLEKIFVTLKTSNGEVLEQNIAALDDAEYGRLMKVCYLARKENEAKLNLISKIAKTVKKNGEKSAIAPR